MGGLMYGYAQGSVGAALGSAISGLFPSSATPTNNSTSMNQQVFATSPLGSQSDHSNRLDLKHMMVGGTRMNETT